MELTQILETWCKITLSYSSFMLSVTLYFHKYIEISRKKCLKLKCRLFMVTNSALYINSRRLVVSINEVAKRQMRYMSIK